MLFLYYLILVFAADVESEQISSALQEIKGLLSTVNLRLARIENRQTRSELLYNRLENKVNGIEKDINQRHSESIILLKNTVSLLNELKVNDDGLEMGQKTMMSQLSQLINNTIRCCQENVTVTCVRAPSIPLSTTPPPTRPVILTTQPPKATTTDCKTVKDGVYQLNVGNEQLQVFCSGGFVTFQRRYDGQLKFDRTFSEYEQGFGSASAEHWMGLRYLHLMTKDKGCTFRAQLALDNTQHNKDLCGTNYTADCDGKIKDIIGQDFRVSSAADMYQIHVVLKHTDFLHPDIQTSFKFNGQKFTTKDRDNDQWPEQNCAALGWLVDNGGFWYNSCEPGFPNSFITSEKYRCNSSLCGSWGPYFFSSSLLQLSC